MMNKHILSHEKLSKLLIILALFGFGSVFTNAYARTQYMLSSGAPACGSCHLTDAVKGLITKQVFDTEQNLGVIGPVWIDSTEGSTFDIFAKMTTFCTVKLHDTNASYTYDGDKQGYVCTHGEAEQTLQTAAIAPGPVVESDQLGTKKTASGATDIWSVTCPADAVQLTVSVKDDAPKNPALVSVQIKKGDAASTTSSDESESKPTFSEEVTLAAGADVYDVLVNKSASKKRGLENYTAKFACKDVDNKVLDITAIEKIQDQ